MPIQDDRRRTGAKIFHSIYHEQANIQRSLYIREHHNVFFTAYLMNGQVFKEARTSGNLIMYSQGYHSKDVAEYRYHTHFSVFKIIRD